MDKLNVSQIRQLLGQLTQPDPSTFLKTSATQASGNPQAAQLSSLLSSTTQLQLPPALRQILAQVQSPQAALSALQNIQSQSSTPQELRTIIESILNSAKQPVVNKSSVNQWFGMNLTSLLAQPTVATNPASPQQNWLQLAIPLLLITIKQGAASRAEGKSQPSNALTSALTQMFGAGANAQQLQQTLRDLQGALQQARLSQIQLADSMSRNEPDYFMSIPWQVEKEFKSIELLMQRRKEKKTQEDGDDVWLLSLRLHIKRTGPVLARVRWNGEQAKVMIYTDNDAATRWLTPHLSKLETELANKGVSLATLNAQTGRIPATLAPDPNQLIRVKV